MVLGVDMDLFFIVGGVVANLVVIGPTCGSVICGTSCHISVIVVLFCCSTVALVSMPHQFL